VRHQIDFHEAGLGIVPLGESAHRNRRLQQRARFRGGQAVRLRLGPGAGQQAICRRRTEAQQQTTRFSIQIEFAMTFQGFDVLRQHRHQAFAADAVGHAPHLFQGRPHPAGVLAAPGPALGRSALRWMVQ
jgi:hypothetical protein